MKSALKRLFWEEYGNLILLNLLTVLCSLPIVTIGPALLALNGTLVRILDERCELRRTRTFWALFKKKFWKGIAAELLVVLYALMLIWASSIIEKQENNAILLLFILAVTILAVVICVWLFLLLSCVEMPFWDALWNAVCLSLGKFPVSLLAAALVWGLSYSFILLYPVSLVPYLVVIISCIAALAVGILWTPLRELVLDSCESVPERTDEAKE